MSSAARRSISLHARLRPRLQERGAAVRSAAGRRRTGGRRERQQDLAGNGSPSAPRSAQSQGGGQAGRHIW